MAQKAKKNSKTEHNLIAAFAGESQARNRYTFYASIAKKEGFEHIAAIFIETADNEKEHAKMYFKHLEGDCAEIINATYPTKMGDTLINLKAAAKGEHEEWAELYPQFGNTAEEEGYAEIANTFRQIAKVEIRHEKRYLKLLANVEKEEVFKKDIDVEWKCRNCGYIHSSRTAPVSCPACLHPQSYYEVFCETP